MSLTYCDAWYALTTRFAEGKCEETEYKVCQWGEKKKWNSRGRRNNTFL